jgi:hypothetical protein
LIVHYLKNPFQSAAKLSRFYHVSPFFEPTSHLATALDIFISLSKQTGGSVCESNAPTTSEMPSAGFEDRNRHRPAYASLSRSINAYARS